MVAIDEATVMIIAGNIGTETYSKKTFLFKPTENSWIAGPELTVERWGHGCGRILEDAESPRFSIIVAGGHNG